MDSTGIGVIIGRYKKLKKRNESIFISNPSNAIEKIFNVKVTSIRTINVKPKKRRVGRYTGLTNRTKKAIVTLQEGQTIELG